MKVTIIGSGNVGSSCATFLAKKNIVREIVLIDIKPKISEGKSLDISQMISIIDSSTKINGYTNDYTKSENSEIIVITCGITRKPGMSRDDLVNTNSKIIRSVVNNSIKLSPNAKFIVVSNPLDVMTYITYMTAKINPYKIIGMAGILDSARYCYFLSKKINVSPVNIQTLLLGGHGDTMVPLYRYTTISGIPIKEFISEEDNQEIIEMTKYAGASIVNYLGTSAWIAPSMSIVKMIESILTNSRNIYCCSSFLKGEYNLKNIFLGVPIILGKNGVEKIIELQLNKNELYLLHKSAYQINNILEKIKL
ncbi:malate dehydrogenase [Blattabacterium cuenoti]|uniref:malate dehydrogenase n=1 Tax=Blattabacterium cuenoti TaxID=1653831 RepID=UPI00163D0C9A|nr:malate dehydrogenase [Blattabacterium cuenoti]